MKSKWQLAFLPVLFVTAMVQAETRDARIDRHFGLLDTNGNGLISREEATVHPPLLKHFRSMDKDKNGGISKYELVNYRTSSARNRTMATVEPNNPGGGVGGPQ